MTTTQTLGDNAQLALDTIHRRSTAGIPSWLLHVMEHSCLDALAGKPPGAYSGDPDATYLAFQRSISTCLLDQWIPHNPLSMGPAGFDSGTERRATTGRERTVVDGVEIEAPEHVVAHLEGHVFPALVAQARDFDEAARTREIIAGEAATQAVLGPDILKSGHGFVRFPAFAYGTYGYAPYFEAFALYPDVIERHFRLQADVALRNNRAAAAAYEQGGLPPLYRLDHDMADSRGLLVRDADLERLWLPQLARCLEPLLRAGVHMLWHCDGNLMGIVPQLLELGLAGFQGFQYEDGMDYARICRMRTRDGQEPLIIAGVSVTRTLPFGTVADVRDELRRLVVDGPRQGLFLAASSSIAPGTPLANIQTLVEGLAHYRRHGRG